MFLTLCSPSVLEGVGELVANVIPYRAGDADPTGLGERLQPRGDVNCLAYTGQSLYLTNWFVRRRGLALSIAFSGVGIGSITVLPWVASLIADAGWRAACLRLGILVLVLLAPLNLLLRRRPEDLGLEPDGMSSSNAVVKRTGNVVDHGWAAVDWTLRRALRTARFWWLAGRLFLRALHLVRGSGPSDQISDRDRFWAK